MTSCTDGMQVSQKIDDLIKENEITVIVIENVKHKTEDVQIDGQFITLNEEHLNLEKVKSLSVSKNELIISF
jgi:hypothetical protein